MIRRVQTFGVIRAVANYISGIIIVIIPTFLAVRVILFEPFYIAYASKLPTLEVGDYVFISKYAYGFSEYSFSNISLFKGRIFFKQPSRGDLVAFRSPHCTIDYIKRVVGLPGDGIQVLQHVLIVSGKLVQRQQLNDYFDPSNSITYSQYLETLPNGREYRILEKPDGYPLLDNTNEFVVPVNEYFVIGDSRDNSVDSRLERMGYIPAENLIGRIELVFSHGKMMVVH